MEILERIWEIITSFFGGILSSFERLITSLFGSQNARYVKKLQSKVDAINSLEAHFEAMSDEELREQTTRFKTRLKDGESADDIIIEAFAVCREGGKRFLGMRHYDVQMIGGMVLHSGSVAEMVTGEGKTLVATLPAYLNALEGRGVHVVTVNDYLARRDMEWMAPLYQGLGLTVGAIQSNMHARERQIAYSKDITYGTNNEFGFDYLRDNMRPAARDDDRFDKRLQQAQGPLAYAIIDEVDNILIDEARTPLIISGPTNQNPSKYVEAQRIALSLTQDIHFQVNEKDHTAAMTDEGIRYAEKLAGVESFYTAGNMDWPHLIDNALRARALYKRDVNYVVKDGAVIIVDEFTGRLMEGRQWSDGLHQAVEAKEGVKIKEETQTLATITLQNYFKLYNKICGMTGTGMTEAEEFWKIYKLNVVAIPTNRTMQRISYPDVIYATEKFKWKAIAEEIEDCHRNTIVTLKNDEYYAGRLKSETEDSIILADKTDGTLHTFNRSKIRSIQHPGRPILVGTVSIEKSEHISRILEQKGIKHEVLNAKNHKREAEIVAQAGRKGAVTIATNMAGRGTDIVLGGNAETMAWARLQDKYPTRLDVPLQEWDELVQKIEVEHKMKEMGVEVKELGGLHVIGSERHDARRIDLQLRGRCGRQGDPGSSRFFLSLDDDLMRIFAGPFVKRVLEMGGFKDDMPIVSGMVSRRIDAAQKKREEYNFEVRKSLLEYDEVMDEQRKRVYRFRQRILDGASCREVVEDMAREQVEKNVESFLAADYGLVSFANYAGKQTWTTLEPRIFKNASSGEAIKIVLDEAERFAETEILNKIEENLAVSEEQSEWNWEALAYFVNTRYGLGVRDRDLKAVGRDRVDEFLIDKARASIRKLEIDGADEMLDPDYGLKSLKVWVRSRFGIDMDIESLRDVPAKQVVSLVSDKAIEAYHEKEANYPVMAGFILFEQPAPAGTTGLLDKDGLVSWASRRFKADISVEDLRSKQRDEIRSLLLEKSQFSQEKASQAVEQLHAQVAQLADRGQLPLANANGAAKSLVDWFKQTCDHELAVEKLEKHDREELEQSLEAIVEDHFHPEFRRMERMVLLEIVDNAWKDHLLAMDYLKSAVGQRGIGQLDPKVEYKREGMRLFEGLWVNIAERVTEIVFRVEQLNTEFVSHTLVETSARHEDFQQQQRAQQQQQRQTSEIGREQEEAIENSGKGDYQVEQLRSVARVGRNDPCPCGSGKKYKVCCMRNLGNWELGIRN